MRAKSRPPHDVLHLERLVARGVLLPRSLSLYYKDLGGVSEGVSLQANPPPRPFVPPAVPDSATAGYPGWKHAHLALKHATQRASGGMVATAEERQAQIDKNRALKKQLQTTHYEIGTDDDYM